MDEPAPIALFALEATHPFGERVALALGRPLEPHEERAFEDGEHKARPLVNVRGRDAYVLQSLHGDPAESVNDKLLKLLFFLATVRDAGAARLTAILPYLAYARKDMRTQPRDPVTSRYVAQLLEATGVDRVVTFEVHNVAAYQNAFRVRAEHLEPSRLFAQFIAAQFTDNERVTVVSPDPGGFKRADRLRQALGRLTGREIELAFVEKARARGVMTSGRIIGAVEAATAVIVDDIIGTGCTLAAAAQACAAQGAARVWAAAAHGLFIPPAAEVLAAAPLERIIVTDTVPPFRLEGTPAAARLAVLPVAPFFAEAIRRLHTGGSLAKLLAG